jgi:hypothetical protein
VIKDIRAVTDSARKKAAPVIENAKKNAEPYVDGIISKADPIIKETRKKADSYIIKAQKAAGPAAEAVKKQSAKAVKAAKTVRDDLTEKAAGYNEKNEVFVQYGDLEVRTRDIVTKCREDYVARGHKPGSIHEIQVYIKPEDRKVYYVVNHEDTGKVEL